MVCIAAFIILCLMSVVVAFLSIFRRDIGRKWWKVFQKAWGCVWKKVRLQKCETNFKDDVKNSILKKVVLKKPHLVKPISIAIEAVSVLIVFITVWSLVVAIKSLLALWVFGTCNISQPSQCSLTSETCSIDQAPASNIVEQIARDFGEWGEIFGAIPDRLKTWRAEDYLSNQSIVVGAKDKPYALDIFDPGCSACLQSYRNQKSTDFFQKHQVILLPFVIKLPDGKIKFANSETITRIILATNIRQGSEAAVKLLDKIFAGSDEKGINYQSILNNHLSTAEAEQLLLKWLSQDLNSEQISAIQATAKSKTVDKIMQDTQDLVQHQLRAKAIPTFIYDGRKHTGLFRANK